jgi:hypothetical protein
MFATGGPLAGALGLTVGIFGISKGALISFYGLPKGFSFINL